jgi:hypothetical protein
MKIASGGYSAKAAKKPRSFNPGQVSTTPCCSDLTSIRCCLPSTLDMYCPGRTVRFQLRDWQRLLLLQLVSRVVVNFCRMMSGRCCAQLAVIWSKCANESARDGQRRLSTSTDRLLPSDPNLVFRHLLFILSFACVAAECTKRRRKNIGLLSAYSQTVQLLAKDWLSTCQGELEPF